MDCQSFLSLLEREGQLARVRLEVDPELEITEIATRVVREHGPALLFERVKGSDIPLAINLFGSEQRVELALGRHPQAIGAELQRLAELMMPPRPRAMLDEWRSLSRVLAMKPRELGRAPVHEVVGDADLSRWPITKSWPQDAGRFITFGQVHTADPETGKRNVGIYRMQVVAPDRILMHWQIQKGGGFHHWKAERMGQPFEVAVAIGGDPMMYLAAAMPLPEGFDEVAFAGFLRGQAMRTARGRSIGLTYSADAELVLEGVVHPNERMEEGPFGDHFGHYSHASPFPVLRIQRMCRKRQPIYMCAVVGKPPQEDKYMGNAVQEIMVPLAKLIHPELRDLWAYYEAGFHSLAAASVVQRFGKEGMKTALGLLGQGQMALTKCLVVVDDDVDARNFSALLRAILANFDPAEDFLLLPGVPFDTLDFTSFTLNLGSKMVLDATRGGSPPSAPARVDTGRVRLLHERIRASRLIDGCLLAVQVEGDGRAVIEELVKAEALAGVKIIAAVSPDVNLDDQESLLWGIFTRFDPARDIVFTQTQMRGAWAVCRGRMGIDATFKSGYPDTIVMDPSIIRTVDHRWHQYWTA